MSEERNVEIASIIGTTGNKEAQNSQKYIPATYKPTPTASSKASTSVLWTWFEKFEGKKKIPQKYVACLLCRECTEDKSEYIKYAVNYY
jgi:hypothetical protein